MFFDFIYFPGFLVDVNRRRRRVCLCVVFLFFIIILPFYVKGSINKQEKEIYYNFDEKFWRKVKTKQIK